jgi:hypothetical protein
MVVLLFGFCEKPLRAVGRHVGMRLGDLAASPEREWCEQATDLAPLA